MRGPRVGGCPPRRRRRRAGAPRTRARRRRSCDRRGRARRGASGGPSAPRRRRRQESQPRRRPRARAQSRSNRGVGGGAGTRPAGGGENGIGVRRGKETGGKRGGTRRARGKRVRRGPSGWVNRDRGRCQIRTADDGRGTRRGGTARRYAHLRGGVAVRLRHGARRAEGSVSPGTRPRAARACDRGRGGRRPTSGSNGQLDGCAAGRRLVDRRRDKT